MAFNVNDYMAERREAARLKGNCTVHVRRKAQPGRAKCAACIRADNERCHRAYVLARDAEKNGVAVCDRGHKRRCVECGREKRLKGGHNG